MQTLIPAFQNVIPDIHWIPVAYALLLIPMRILRRSTWVDQIVWTAFYAFFLWSILYNPKWFFPGHGLLLWMFTNFSFSLIFSKRIIFGTRRHDLIWYGMWLTAVICSDLAHGAEVTRLKLLWSWITSPAKLLEEPRNALLEAVILLIIAFIVLLRDLYMGYIPWLRKSPCHIQYETTQKPISDTP